MTAVSGRLLAKPACVKLTGLGAPCLDPGSVIHRVRVCALPSFRLRSPDPALSRPGTTPPGSGPDAYPEDTMEWSSHEVRILGSADLSRADLDGAIVALSQDEAGTITAEIRIPGPPVP